MPYEGGVASLSQSTGRVRALLLLALLLSGGIASLLPASTAQVLNQPVMCLDRDDRPNGICRPDGDPDYSQGDTIDVSIAGTNGANVRIAARCLEGCPAGDRSATTTYFATTDDSATVRFPDDFTEEPGGNAAADKAPRYNSTWEFSATLPGGAPLVRKAQVWLVDVYKYANQSVRPGERHSLRVAGADGVGDIRIEYQRKRAGSWETFDVTSVRVPAFTDIFTVPITEAQYFHGCAPNFNDCYRLVVDASGKSREIVPLRVAYADIDRGSTTPRPANTPTIMRTQNASFGIDLYYPGGELANGPKFTTEHAAVAPAFGERALRVAVEKVNATGEVTLLDEVPARYEPDRLMWRAQWTVPRELPIDRASTYRLRLLESQDAWGNRIPSDILGGFTVDVASIKPVVAEAFTTLPRSSEGTIALRVDYLNGTPFTPAQAAIEGNESPLSGCFARVATPPPEPAPDPTPDESGSCLSRDLTWGRYDPTTGTWNFTIRYPRDYAELNAHRFILQNGTDDRFGNHIFQVVSRPFDVTVAKPDVVLNTTMGGEDVETFERGRSIFLLATITYGDGSAFNSTVRPNPDTAESRVLTATLTRRGPAPGGGYGPIASIEPLNFTEVDPHTGRWGARLDLDRDDTSPVGVWSLEFDVQDAVEIPNQNRVSFDREVVSSLIRLCPSFQPSERIPTDSILRFRFRLFYSECGLEENAVPTGIVSDRIAAQVYRFNPRNHTLAGPPVSGSLVPSLAEGSDTYQLEYRVPNELFVGTYAIGVNATDQFGNKLIRNARSAPFTTYTIPVNRSIITEPALEVRRGESAVVVFDAREGDTGLNPPVTQPRIELHRFDPESTECGTAEELGGCWVRERFDVRVPDPTLSDLMGEFVVDVNTAVGLYRFALQGRDAQFRNIIGLSRNFTVVPTEVSRAFVAAPPERVVKGEVFNFTLEHFGGDDISERLVLYNGLPIRVQPPQVKPLGATVNLTWAIPYDAPNGNYTVIVRGQDVNGNTISVVSPPIEATAASLQGRILGQPPRTVERNAETRVLFGITYPDGQYYVGAQAPRVVVRNDSGLVAEATVRRESLTFSAAWKPNPRTTLGEYWFEIAGSSGVGNDFPPLRTSSFRVLPGEVTRSAVDEIPPQIERLSTGTFSVASNPTDKFAGFELVYYGGSTTPVSPGSSPLELSRAPIAHTIDQGASKYVVRVVTDVAAQTGTYRIVMRGEDSDGNQLTGQSRYFAITPTAIIMSWDTYPKPEAFGEGKTIEFFMTARYRGGTIMDDTYGTPSVALVLTGAGQVTPRPEIEYASGKWRLFWTAPDAPLLDGSYLFNVGGADDAGNTIVNSRSVPYNVRSDFATSFGKLVPGPSPALVALFAALAALALGGVTRSRRER